MNFTTEPIRDKKKLQELLIYLKGTSTRNYILAKVQLNTALRISDIVNLKAGDFLMSNGGIKEHLTLKEKKTGKLQNISINSALKSAIKDYIAEKNFQDDSYLFPSKKGTNSPITTTQAHRIFQAAGKALHIENFNSHALRKTWGWNAYRKTKNIALIMQAYNHTSVVQTLKYIGITQTDKDTLYNDIQF